MNKYQRAKSRKVKKIIRWYHCYGYKITYKEAKRIERTTNRIISRIKSIPAKLAKGRKRLAYNMLHVGSPMIHEHRDHCDGFSAGFITIDESTPIEETPALWPKENPNLGFETRRLGKFYFKEETK